MKRACIVGWPVAHSRSPLIHETWLREFGIDGAYVKEAVAPEAAASFLKNLADRGYAGCNVTVPHKEVAFQTADITDAAAQAVGAANTLWLEDGKLHATNTDTYGFMAYLNAKAETWKNNPGPAVVLGAGGASRAILFGLLEQSPKDVYLLNRTAERAEELRKHFGARVTVIDWAERNDAVKDAGVIVNTTSLGMTGKPALDIDISGAPSECVVADIVYTPLETGLLKAAKAKGLTAVDGLGMLLHQAVPGFEKWFGRRPAVSDALYQKIAADVRSS